MSNGNHEDGKETVKTTYFVSMESSAAHAGADLRVMKVWYKGDKAVRWESTEERWDFGPNVPGDWQGGKDLPGGVTDSGEKKQSGTGEPPRDLPPDPKPPKEYSWAFFPIDEDGYKAAKKWVEPQVTTVGKGKDAKTLPGKTHVYNINTYNCG